MHEHNSPPKPSLLRQFLPMSASDMAMALGDPIILFVLASLPKGPVYLAAFAIGKGVAVFFESPIISVLPASNALASHPVARSVFFKFVLITGFLLTSGMILIGLIPSVLPLNAWLQQDEVWETAYSMILLLSGWPICIALRRYWQGQIIRSGNIHYIAYGALVRLILLTLISFSLAAMTHQGEWIASAALMSGLIGELLFIRSKIHRIQLSCDVHSQPALPTNLASVSRYYWPLAHSMVSLWGARLVLPIFIATVSLTAIAAWSAAWACVIALSNGVRMVQQLVIRNILNTPLNALKRFTLGIGISFSLILLLIATTPWGELLSGLFSGGDANLAEEINWVILASVPLPLLMAVQNYLQGILMHQVQTQCIGRAAFIANLTLILGTLVLSYLGCAAFFFALLVCCTTALEIAILRYHIKGTDTKNFVATFSIH